MKFTFAIITLVAGLGMANPLGEAPNDSHLDKRCVDGFCNPAKHDVCCNGKKCAVSLTLYNLMKDMD